MAKSKVTREQLQARKEKAERFTRNVLEDSDRADEIAHESLDEYAARRKIRLSNPTHRSNHQMPRRLSREDLEDRVAELEAENEELQDQIDQITDIVTGEEEEDEEEQG